MPSQTIHLCQHGHYDYRCAVVVTLLCLIAGGSNCKFSLKKNPSSSNFYKRWKRKPPPPPPPLPWCLLFDPLPLTIRHKRVKVIPDIFLPFCFSNLKEKERTFETRESFFYFNSKVLFVLKINCKVLESCILWLRQMPKHWTKNTFNWLTWEVSPVQ